MKRDRPLPCAGAFGLLIGLATFACFDPMGPFDEVAMAGSATSGATGALLWWSGNFLPRGHAPSAGASGLLASPVPAAFIPEAYFIGAGMLFMLYCAVAGGVFGFVFDLFIARHMSAPDSRDTAKKQQRRP